MTTPAPEPGPWVRRLPLLACLFVLIAGYVYSSQLGALERFKDEREYVRIAYNIGKGIYSKNGEDPTAYRAPVYPVLLGLVIQGGGLGISLRMTNYVALALTVLLGYRFLARRGRPRAGALAAVLAAVYPPFLYTASTLYPQTIGALLLVWAVSILPEGARFGIGRGIGLGLVCGLLTLAIPTFLAGVGLLLLWQLWRGRAQALPGVLVAGVCLSACVGAWSWRNYRAFDAFVPLTTNAGRNLLLGNSENTTATSGVNVDVTRYSDLAEEQGLGEVERDRLYRDAALEWITENPGAWLRLYVLKVLNHFNIVNTYATDEEIGGWETVVLAVFFLPLLGILLWRLVRLREEPFFRTESALLLLYLGMALATALFFTRIRFRLPLDHLLIWIAAAWLLRHRDRLPAGGAGAPQGDAASS